MAPRFLAQSQSFGNERFEKAATAGVGHGKACLELVAEVHQGVYFGNDTELLGERRESVGSRSVFAFPSVGRPVFWFISLVSQSTLIAPKQPE